MLSHLMQSKLLSIGAESEKDRFKGLEMRKLNDTKKFTSQALLVLRTTIKKFKIILWAK